MVCVASGKGINGCQETDENRGECRDIMADRKIEIDLEYKGLESCLEGIGADFQGEGYGLERLLDRYRSFRKPGMKPAEAMEALSLIHI